MWSRCFEAQYDPDHDDAITFVAVYYEGRCVATAIDEDYRFSLQQSIGLTVQVLDALAYVHAELGVVHRDVKPGNVMLEAGRRTARLGDFGSAAPVEADGTVAGMDGTPLYTPPEAGPSDGRMSTAGDCYGTGLVLFEMVNGPYPYATIDPEAVDRRLTRGLPALPQSTFQFEPHVPDALRRVIRKGMRPDAATRFQTPSEFIAALQAVRCIDWTHIEGRGLDGTWVGGWPPQVAEHRRRRYQVTSRVLEAGRDRGRRRLEARQASSATGQLSRFGVADVTIDADDRAGAERFFAAVEAMAAQRVPAR